jgi:hypothetical protein
MSNNIMGGTQSLSVVYVARWNGESLVISLPCGTEYSVVSTGEHLMISTPSTRIDRSGVGQDPIVREFCARIFTHCASGRAELKVGSSK